jgi:hypothetical protein
LANREQIVDGIGVVVLNGTNLVFPVGLELENTEELGLEIVFVMVTRETFVGEFDMKLERVELEFETVDAHVEDIDDETNSDINRSSSSISVSV